MMVNKKQKMVDIEWKSATRDSLQEDIIHFKGRISQKSKVVKLRNIHQLPFILRTVTVVEYLPMELISSIYRVDLR